MIKIAKEENFYRGKKLEFGGSIQILNVKPRDWDTIILDSEYKKEIRAYTVGFLRQTKLWQELDIPTKRGVLLAGEPGTGKTIVCRAIMGEADGITCISTSAYDLGEEHYISALYEIAQDLSPCIIFIEDIELIGQDRLEFGLNRGPALLSLLAQMDGIEPKKEIVTVATTNCLDILDKALSHRPSRFDRVINFECPIASERAVLVEGLCKKINLEQTSREYIVSHTDGFTPAQIQETVFGLAIEFGRSLGNTEIKASDIARIISRINGARRKQLGFNHMNDARALECQSSNIQNRVIKSDLRS
jgi:cell division protease FtsH